MATPIIVDLSQYKLTKQGFILKPRPWKTKLLIALSIVSLAFIPKAIESSYVKYTPIQQIQEEKETEIQTVLVQKFGVAKNDAKEIVENVFRWSAEFKLSPSLVFGIIAAESTFNKHAISNVGAFGLMQVLPKWHLEKIHDAKKVVGSPELFNIKTNIYLGTRIYRDCYQKFKNTENALKCYNGSYGTPTNYDQKVLTFKKKFDPYI